MSPMLHTSAPVSGLIASQLIGPVAKQILDVSAHAEPLPGETLVYPAHDYSGRHVSSIAQEKTRNPRLGGGKTLEEFTAIMASLNLPYPKFIDHAVPGNKACGECPTNLPQELQKYCGQMAESPQG